MKPKIFAFEGMNGSGKSSSINNLTAQLQTNGLNVGIHKVAGIGNGPRIAQLCTILDYREKLRLDGRMTQKQTEDYLKDRIFRLATRSQVKEYMRQTQITGENVSLIDRTPLISWIYQASIGQKNPYINEILDESMNLTRQLGIDTIFLFDIPATTAFARIMSRTCLNEPDPQSRMTELCHLIQAPPQISDEIIGTALHTIYSNPNLTPKPFSIWDYMKYDDVVRQRENYIRAVEMVNTEYGQQYRIVDATKSSDEVLQDVKTEIEKYI